MQALTPERPVVLVEGDCIERMRELEAASVQVVLTDPPAGIGFMGKAWDSFAGYSARTPAGHAASLMLGVAGLLRRCRAALASVPRESAVDALVGDIDKALGADVELAPWARGFVVFMVDVWTEASRVLVPGGWVCAWALPKTSDLAGLALRLAGLEVVDMGLHLFGSGMPKGCNVGKQLDKEAGAVREVVGTKAGMPGYSLAQSKGATAYGGGIGGNGDPESECRITAPATPEAQAWDGWNTQLAPGFECWHLARKPRERGLSLAANAVKHGAGALNIDACRVPREAGQGGTRCSWWPEPCRGHGDAGRSQSSETRHGSPPPGWPNATSGGSYPPNVLLTHALDCEPGRCVDGCPCKALDEQSGEQRDGTATKRPGCSPFSSGDKGEPTAPSPSYVGQGGASRYFPQLRYQAKAKRRDIPGRAATLSHPTHKHPDLMRWLVRLLAAKHWGPAGPLVLDPFAGSGTTLVACLAEGVRCIGIELDPVNVAEARARLGAAMGDPESAREDNAKTAAGEREWQMALL